MNNRPRRPGRFSFNTFPLARAGAALALLVWLLQRERRSSQAIRQVAPEQPAPALWMVDLTKTPGVTLPDAGTPAPNTPLPAAPLAGQVRKREECIPMVARYINGGCWIGLLDAKPPCVLGTFHHAGACFAPQMTPPATPTSIIR
jgi:hypothetical protein